MAAGVTWEAYRGLRLAVSVHVHNPETGETSVFLAGDDPPEWARRLMGPHVYGFKRKRSKQFDSIQADRDDDGNVQVVRIVCSAERHARPQLIEQMEGGTILDIIGEYGQQGCLLRRDWRFTRGHYRLGDGGQPDYVTPRTRDADGKTVHPGGYAPASPRFACSCGDNVSVQWARLTQILDQLSSAGVSELSLNGLHRLL